MPSKSSPAFFGLTPATKQFIPLAYSRHIRVWNWPVLPVIPCVMTLVFLLIRMLIRRPRCNSGSFEETTLGSRLRVETTLGSRLRGDDGPATPAPLISAQARIQ